MAVEHDDETSAWQRGVPLSFAWLIMARPADRLLYQGGGDRRHSIQFSMIADLWDRLGSGKLLAVGLQTAPAVHLEPVYLPKFLFANAPPGLFTDDMVRGTGVSFEHVRIVRRRRSPPTEPRPSTVLHVKQDKPGRRDLYPLCQPVLRELATEFNVRTAADWHRMPSAERLHVRFKALYAHHHESSLSPAPSIRSLRTYLNTFRKQLAANGKS